MREHLHALRVYNRYDSFISESYEQRRRVFISEHEALLPAMAELGGCAGGVKEGVCTSSAHQLGVGGHRMIDSERGRLAPNEPCPALDNMEANASRAVGARRRILLAWSMAVDCALSYFAAHSVALEEESSSEAEASSSESNASSEDTEDRLPDLAAGASPSSSSSPLRGRLACGASLMALAWQRPPLVKTRFMRRGWKRRGLGRGEGSEGVRMGSARESGSSCCKKV